MIDITKGMSQRRMKMNKYHVKFSYMVQTPIINQSNIPIKIIEVNDIYEVEPHVDIFSFIYSRFNVVGSVKAEQIGETK